MRNSCTIILVFSDIDGIGIVISLIFSGNKAHYKKSTIFYKAPLDVSETGEFKSSMAFSKFWTWFFVIKEGFATKITIFHQIFPKVFGVENSDFDVRFPKFCTWFLRQLNSSRFSVLQRNIISYFSQNTLPLVRKIKLKILRNRLQIPIPRLRLPSVNPYKKSLFSQNSLPLVRKIKLKILRNWLQIQIPRPRLPSVNPYKKSLFFQNTFP